MIRRRDFLRNSVAAAGIVWLSPGMSLSAALGPAAARIEVVLDEPLGTIDPNIYGHFAENLSGVIYDGIWVGENSKVPNINGIRKELVEEMRKIKPPIVRFPGGCFADSYDWRDGVGTIEFAEFCRLLGAQPYLAANLRSLPAEQFYRWVEYCNSPAGSTTLADERAAAGFKDPFNVRYWGVGNESWGVAETSPPRSMRWNFVDIRRGFRLISTRGGEVENWRLSLPARTMTTGIGRAVFLKKSCAKAGLPCSGSTASLCTTTHGTSAVAKLATGSRGKEMQSTSSRWIGTSY